MQLKLRWPHLLPITVLGFSSGLPLALSGSTLQAWFTQAGVSLKAIGILTLLGLPYLCKPIWAPLFDRYQLPWLGRRRGWLFLIQLMCATVLVAMAHGSPQHRVMWLAVSALLLSFSSASQDIVFDAYRTDLLAVDERSMGAACNTWGYRVAMFVSGGLAWVLADRVGWALTYYTMAALMLVCAAVTWFSPDPKDDERAPKTLLDAVILPFKQFLSQRWAWWILLFIVLYKIGDAFLLSLTSAFLLRGMHFTMTQIGLVYKSVGMVATLLGVLIAGVYQPRLGMYKALWVFGILQGVSNLAFMVLWLLGPHIWMLGGAIFIESFCGGLGSAVFVAFLMTLCDHRYSATQFALFSALAASGRVLIGPVAAAVADTQGWMVFFIWSFVISFPCLGVLWWMRRHPVFQSA